VATQTDPSGLEVMYCKNLDISLDSGLDVLFEPLCTACTANDVRVQQDSHHFAFSFLAFFP
jgi:hypothetical protein